MSFQKDDRVVLHDEHSEFDGQVGTVEQVSETMFGDETYVVSFEEGQEAGLPEDNLEAADDEPERAEEGTDAAAAEPADEDDA
jgi:hypothetical protein